MFGNYEAVAELEVLKIQAMLGVRSLYQLHPNFEGHVACQILPV